MTLSEQEFIINCFRIKLAFEQLDAMMSNGAGMPEQWQMSIDFNDVRDIH